MALIKCGECGRALSEMAPACPQCGAPAGTPCPPGVRSNRAPALELPKGKEKNRTRPAFWVALAVMLGGGFFVYRAATSNTAAPPSAGLRATFRQPQKVVSEKISLKEGQAMTYSFQLRTDARVEVKVQATPKDVDVMLMTSAELERFKKATGELFGGRYTYRQALSRKSILNMSQTEILPAGKWAIVVRRPEESVLFGDNTAASVDVTVY